MREGASARSTSSTVSIRGLRFASAGPRPNFLPLRKYWGSRPSATAHPTAIAWLHHLRVHCSSTKEMSVAPSRLVALGQAPCLPAKRFVHRPPAPDYESDLLAHAIARAKEGDAGALHFLYVRFADDV